MKDSIKIDKEYQELFLLDEAKLRKIVEIIQNHSKGKKTITELIFEVVHNDKSKYQTDLLENVLSDENIKGREIISIKFVLKEKEEKSIWGDPLCEIKFTATEDTKLNYSFGDKPIMFKIDDSDKAWAYSFSEELDLYIKRTLKGSKKKILSILEWFDIVIPIVVFCLGLLLSFSYFPQLNIKIGDLTLSQIIIGLPLIIIVIVILYSLYDLVEPFTKLSKILQGESIFYIGDQKEIYDKRKRMINNITWIVIVGFLVSLVAGLVIALTIK